MKEHILEEIHNYTKFKVVELLIDKHNDGITLKNFEEIEDLTEELLTLLGLVGMKYYTKRKNSNEEKIQ